jgi:hypothetical protein
MSSDLLTLFPFHQLQLSTDTLEKRLTNVRAFIAGSHNEFPAYEIIANGNLIHAAYPTTSGPVPLNFWLFYY